MDTTALKSFAQQARLQLIEEVGAKLKLVLSEGSSASRENPHAIKNLQLEIEKHSEAGVIDRVAYFWFNRFCALRFMDLNGYTYTGVVSPENDQIIPAVLTDAKLGNFDGKSIPEQAQIEVNSLLEGSVPSKDPQAEAYVLLLVAVCNYWHNAMPFLFQRVNDYTELLIPNDLLSTNSVLSQMREALTAENCNSVEVIGWLYQFYISERKDEIFDDLKKNIKINAQNIPAATQLFTPGWIVRYLVQNSLGRLWMLNHPNSDLIKHMEYFIPSKSPETDFLKINRPEDLKLCDPACGSGHILTYAFDLLYKIYEEQGYNPTDIPEKILKNNLYGIELDERAGELAAFALSMKARAHQRRFFNKGIKPNICVLEKIDFSTDELENYINEIGQDLFTEDLLDTLKQFDEVDNFGSLIIPKAKDIEAILGTLDAKNVGSNLFLMDTHKKVLKVLNMANYLSPRYHVVVANPPYMGGKGMNPRLSSWAKNNYPNSKSDLFAMFIERNLELANKRGYIGMVTMQSWMFLSSYENLRSEILEQNTIISMAHLGARAFDSIGGEVVSTTAFIIENFYKSGYQGAYIRLVDGNSEDEKIRMMAKAIEQAKNCNTY